ncbi:profilin-4 isoform X2 [Pygocentrus nattereri]|uniref:profilin-4 isoform X2 n=1 Tax=Pygocentrus nattereri TaxID=42514 RepID=UPI0008147CB1|nr:profilin-4 isoform X2 [Pygocentrus nattereri]
MNPFQNLIVDCLINTKHVESAAVLVAHSGSVAAASPGLRVRPRDAQALTGAFRRLAAVRERGLERGLSGSFSFQEEGFGCVRADRISIYCKRLNICGRRGNETQHHGNGSNKHHIRSKWVEKKCPKGLKVNKA